MYNRDLVECQQFANQRMSALQGAAAGAVLGAILGHVLAPRGFESSWQRRGAIAGGLGGAAGTNDTQESIIKNCMSGRGYKVLN